MACPLDLFISSSSNIFNRFLDYDILTEKTNFGIHKDDYLFYINNKPIKNFASQGQQKSFIISLKMSEYYIISEKLSISPLMMLDDIFDKLDNKRISDLMKFIKNKIKGQIFITDALNDRIKIFNSKDDNINVISIKKRIENPNKYEPAYIVFENYELILKWNRSLRFALAVCTLKEKFKNEI